MDISKFISKINHKFTTQEKEKDILEKGFSIAF